MSIILHNSDIIKISTTYDRDFGQFVVDVELDSDTPKPKHLILSTSLFYKLHAAISDSVEFIDRNCCFDEKPKG